MTVKIGIMGYGNLGKGVECAIVNNPDMELVTVFTRRDPSDLALLTPDIKVHHVDDAESFIGKIDVMILCGGSASDLPVQTPKYAKHFNVVDSFDNHGKIPEHFEKVDFAARKGKKLALISAGWDPGMFSLNRLYGNAILPKGMDYTFWGKGVSQGHSDAIRRIPGVKDAKQYTIPIEDALNQVRKGQNPMLEKGDRHRRECFVVAEEGSDLEFIRNQIVTMPDYFEGYDTSVSFITQEELDREHGGMPHGGTVIRSGRTGWNNENIHTVEYRLNLGLNPEFTASVLIAAARAVNRLNKEGETGCKTLFDIPPAYLSARTGGELRQQLL
ncbi:MAG: diaminopimelate dehydrogenase [Anaerovoracaceae bacterium]|jgi:diaminopimelate dehydrogenase